MATVGPTVLSSDKATEASADLTSDRVAVLVDLSKCIGCRKCEFACNQAGDFDHKPMAAFEDMSIMKTLRRHESDTFTVINEYHSESSPRPVYVKTQCHHCLDPACYSACLVSAFSRQPSGPVTYDLNRCMGCRYCMVACPFNVPAFEYDRAMSPRIRKCNFCVQRLAENKLPACVDICPVQCMTFGHRHDLIHLAHSMITAHPGEYIDHVYGEHEVGGTSWLYVSSVPFDTIGFPKLPDAAPPRFIEGIQHGIFKACLAPLLVAGFLGSAMMTLKSDANSAVDKSGQDDEELPE